MLTLQAIFGIAAGILAFSANPVYILDILRGNTKPSRITWWVLGLLNVILAFSYYASGARDTIWIPIAYSVSFLIIGGFSIKYGEGGWTRLDLFCLAGAIVSAAVWWLFHSPVIAQYMTICIDFFALIPTIYKSYKRPWTEDRTAWVIAGAASLLNVFAIENWTPAVSLYPFYVFITNLIIVIFIVWPQHKPSGEKSHV